MRLYLKSNMMATWRKELMFPIATKMKKESLMVSIQKKQGQKLRHNIYFGETCQIDLISYLLVVKALYMLAKVKMMIRAW